LHDNIYHDIKAKITFESVLLRYSSNFASHDKINFHERDSKQNKQFL
jgi:hypothetical protein